MRVRIVSYEDVNAWILGKFARKLNEELIALGVNSDIGMVADPKADINHHIIYVNYNEALGTTADTLMVTHIDDFRKLSQLKRQLQVARVGICMSKPLMNELIVGGVPAEKLAYINPAHDGRMPLKKFVIGIASQVKPDGCKREHLIAELASRISPKLFTFKIMGSGWEAVNRTLVDRGFELHYQREFDYNRYLEFIPSLDYYLYMGQDEGSMGFIDALAAGVKTIVTPQGFHLDAHGGIDHAFNTLEELVAVFDQIATDRIRLTESVTTWTWPDYAAKHLEIWKYMIDPSKQIVSHYQDGLNSWVNKNTAAAGDKRAYQLRLYRGAFKRTAYKIRVGFTDFTTFKKKLRSFLKNLTGQFGR